MIELLGWAKEEADVHRLPAHAAALTQAIDQLRWRSVEDELPEDTKAVLVRRPTNKCSYTAWYNGDWNGFYAPDYSVLHWQSEITHWLPIPAAPEE